VPLLPAHPSAGSVPVLAKMYTTEGAAISDWLTCTLPPSIHAGRRQQAHLAARGRTAERRLRNLEERTVRVDAAGLMPPRFQEQTTVHDHGRLVDMHLRTFPPIHEQPDITAFGTIEAHVIERQVDEGGLRGPGRRRG
jgi:hypothetical protein